MIENLILAPYWVFEARDRRGGLIYREAAKNTSMTVGIHHLFDVVFNAGSQEPNWYMGLTDANPTIDQGDTMSSHAGWSEITAYSETTRQAWQTAAAASRGITNTANKAVFTINADSTIVGGGFIVSNATKGGTSGILFAATANPAGDQSLDIGQTVTLLGAYSL